jgi:hypothetical protein
MPPCCELLNKSGLSFAAAEILQRNTYPASAAHCAYYSCFQMMKHLALCVLAFFDSESDMNADRYQDGDGIHEYLINKINEYLLDKKIDHHSFSKIIQLKKLRTKADYSNKRFENGEGSSAIILAREILQFLKTI